MILTFSLVFAFIIMEQNYADLSWFKVGRSKLLTGWGKITYGLYCLHFLVYFFVRIITGPKFLNMPIDNLPLHILKVATAFLLCIFICKLSFKYFESPFLKLKDRLS